MKWTWLNKAVPIWIILIVVLATAITVFAITVLLPPTVVEKTVQLIRPIKYNVTVNIVQVDAEVTTIDLTPWSYTICTTDSTQYNCPIITLQVNFRNIQQDKPPVKISVEIYHSGGGLVAWGDTTLLPDHYVQGSNTVRITMNFVNPSKSWDELVYDWMKYIIVKLEPAPQ